MVQDSNISDDTGVVVAFADADAGRDDDDLRKLGADITELRLGHVDFAYAEPEAFPAKSATGIIEALTVVLLAGRGLSELVRLAADLAARVKRPVRVKIGADELTVNATREQQKAIIEAFLARHAAEDA